MNITLACDSKNPKIALYMLPGRDTPGLVMHMLADMINVKDVMYVVIEPTDLRWYKAPNGPNDQQETVWGIREMKSILAEKIGKISGKISIPVEKSLIIGHSAGGVMAFETHQEMNQSFMGVAILSGAIIDLVSVKTAISKSPIMLKHCVDDECFKYEERYLPMKHSLHQHGYVVNPVEFQTGGHGMDRSDSGIISNFLKRVSNYAV